MRARPDFALAVLLALASTGCAEYADGGRGDADDAAYLVAGDADPMSPEQNRELAGYVSYIELVAATDEAGWNRVLGQISSATESDPTPGNRLRLALVLSRADRPATDLQAAQNLLEAILEESRDVSPAVSKLARVKLVETEQRIVLYQTVESLRSQLAVARHEVSSEKQERTRVEFERAQVEAEIRRIQAALADALAKLEAVANIERSVERSQNEAPIP